MSEETKGLKRFADLNDQAWELPKTIKRTGWAVVRMAAVRDNQTDAEVEFLQQSYFEPPGTLKVMRVEWEERSGASEKSDRGKKERNDD